MKTKSSNKLLISGVIFTLLLYIAILFLSPKPIDWRLSFSKNDQIPFGNSILFEELKTLFPQEEIKTCHSPLYNYLEDFSVENTGFIYINQSFEPDQLDVNKLVDLVNSGNNVFIAAKEFGESIMDTLGFKLDQNFNISIVNLDSSTVNLVNPILKSPWGYTYKKAYNKVYFEAYDTLRTTVLGLGNQAKTNFIKIKKGQGHFYINLNPMAFTNYNLLIENNYEYAFKSLSYLPEGPVIWDEHYKGKALLSSSALRYILSQKALRYAWYIFLFGTIIYLIFGAKRRQRIIPIFTAPVNTTLSFIETIGRLYYKKRNHLDIAQKKYKYFLEFLRSRYYVNTSMINSELFEEIAEKCDVPQRTVKQLFDIATNLNNASGISEEDLEQFNKKIEFFYEKCKKNQQ
ncbi:DUF4350 domain-containing protein [Labilibacter sediminis]|nr:DUF4350 domain-containing protein [Labilibacter sediminis]